MPDWITWLIIGIYGIAMLFIFAYSIVQLRLLVNYRRSLKSQTNAPPLQKELPSILVQLPVYNELYVVERLIDAATQLDYPHEKLEIQLLDDSSDESFEIAQERVAFWQKSGINIRQIKRPVRTGFKAGALQYGMDDSDSDLVAIFDADFIPSTDFLLKTIAYFQNPEIGMVQTRWGHLNRNYSLLTRVQAFALDAHFTVEQTGRNAAFHFINFNGTAGIWRRECILDAGGWSADMAPVAREVRYPAVDAVSIRRATRQNGRSRRRAKATCRITLRESHPLRREPIQIRRLNAVVTVASQISPAEIVGEKDHDVGAINSSGIRFQIERKLLVRTSHHFGQRRLLVVDDRHRLLNSGKTRLRFAKRGDVDFVVPGQGTLPGGRVAQHKLTRAVRHRRRRTCRLIPGDDRQKTNGCVRQGIPVQRHDSRHMDKIRLVIRTPYRRSQQRRKPSHRSQSQVEPVKASSTGTFNHQPTSLNSSNFSTGVLPGSILGRAAAKPDPSLGFRSGRDRVRQTWMAPKS